MIGAYDNSDASAAADARGVAKAIGRGTLEFCVWVVSNSSPMPKAFLSWRPLCQQHGVHLVLAKLDTQARAPLEQLLERPKLPLPPFCRRLSPRLGLGRSRLFQQLPRISASPSPSVGVLVHLHLNAGSLGRAHLDQHPVLYHHPSPLGESMRPFRHSFSKTMPILRVTASFLKFPQPFLLTTMDVAPSEQKHRKCMHSPRPPPPPHIHFPALHHCASSPLPGKPLPARDQSIRRHALPPSPAGSPTQ